MTGRVWDHRQIRRDAFVLTRDGFEVGLVTFDGVERPAALVRSIVSACADFYGDRAAEDPVDWRALGWSNRAEHDAMLRTVDELRDSWAEVYDAPFAAMCGNYVREQRVLAGLPLRPPYSVDAMSTLDAIVRAAPDHVAQLVTRGPR